jgi:hypothetical protein
MDACSLDFQAKTSIPNESSASPRGQARDRQQVGRGRFRATALRSFLLWPGDKAYDLCRPLRKVRNDGHHQHRM